MKAASPLKEIMGIETIYIYLSQQTKPQLTEESLLNLVVTMCTVANLLTC